MTYRENANGFVVETASYRAKFNDGNEPIVQVWRELSPMLGLPAVSGLASVEQGETLTDARVSGIRAEAGCVELTLVAQSNLWTGRTFHWTFHEDRIEHYHTSAGACAPGRCYFFSSIAAGDGQVLAKEFGVRIDAQRVWSPAANMADEYERPLGIAQSLGILPEVETPFAYGVPDRVAMIFAPPPFCLVFGQDDQWVGVGIGTEPGGYQFNAFEYSSIPRGSSDSAFFVNYLGYTSFDRFVSPRAVLQFGFSPYEVLEKHVGWTDAQGFSTQHPFGNALWHRRPIFCGWGEQCTVATSSLGKLARDEATQANYEVWIPILEKRGLPIGTVVIDDKWQKNYGTFDVDTGKWPNMGDFVARQHAAGRHVLVWIPTFHAEGLPAELCVFKDGKAVAADVSNPAYETFLREKVRHLVRDVGIDGFKVDWVWGFTRVPGVRTHAPLHGIEWLRRFQAILYEETHRWRSDAMIETHSASPLFRESSDVLRLNDLHPGARDIVSAMAMRARIARIAGWRVVDCDASSHSLNEWWQYMQAQPRIGTPALYLVSGDRPAWMWPALAALWQGYCGRLEQDA